MATQIPARTIIWALDPFETQIHSPVRLLSALLPKGKSTTVRIEPVYVLGTLGLGIPIPVAEEAMRRKLSRIRLRGLQTPKVLSFDGESPRSAVEALLKYAKSRGADLIVSGTHGRKGIPRLFLGSFAETLLLHSRVPVLIAHPQDRPKGIIRRIIFPTDLSRGSRRAFQRAIRLACACRARLVLVHAVPHPVEPLIQSGASLIGGGWIPSSELMSEVEEQARKTLVAWVREAEKAGAPAQFIVQPAPLPVRDVILSTARANDLIAMGAESGPVAAAIVGSVTRQVVRQARCPVWVIRA